MSSLTTKALQSNKNLKINFNGGDLSSDGGLLLLKEFLHQIDFQTLIRKQFKTKDSARFRIHTDADNLLQRIFQIIGGYFNDDDADELTNDPVFCAVLEKTALASQPTLSRFASRMDEDTLRQFETIHSQLRRTLYSIRPPAHLLLDLDSTLLDTYGKQEGQAFNYHYQAHGYHPLVCYDGLTGDLLKIQLREGADYSSTGVVDFLQPLLDELLAQYPKTQLFLRGDSGFATPKLYAQAESNGCSYAIRLKSNQSLHRHAQHLTDELNEQTRDNKVDYAVCYGEFFYQAQSWSYPRRVVCKVEKPAEQMTYLHTFIVTNMDLPPQALVRFYCNRGRMENFIKESKNGFNFCSMSSHSKVVNANRLQICMLAYNLFNGFRRLVLPAALHKMQVATLRLKLIRIAAKVVRSARYITYKLCGSCPYKNLFYETLDNIHNLTPKLE